jgi:hypothetical protein
MGNGETKTATPGSRKLFLTSVESFCGDDKGFPSSKSMIFTVVMIIAFLVMIELTLRQFFISIQVSQKCIMYMYISIVCIGIFYDLRQLMN